MKLSEKRLYVYVLEFRNNLRSFTGDLRSVELFLKLDLDEVQERHGSLPSLPHRRTQGDGWVLKTNDGTLVQTYTRVSKTSATNMAASLLKALWHVASQKSELRIRNKNGTFGKARTYPRAADPRRSKG